MEGGRRDECWVDGVGTEETGEGVVVVWDGTGVRMERSEEEGGTWMGNEGLE